MTSQNWVFSYDLSARRCRDFFSIFFTKSILQKVWKEVTKLAVSHLLSQEKRVNRYYPFYLDIAYFFYEHAVEGVTNRWLGNYKTSGPCTTASPPPFLQNRAKVAGTAINLRAISFANFVSYRFNSAQVNLSVTHTNTLQPCSVLGQ